MKRALAAALCIFTAGCSSGRKVYTDEAPLKNISVRPQLSGVRGALHIHSVDAQCKTEYRGTVDLDRASVPVGLPAGRMSYLVFDFSGSSLLRGSHSISSATLLTPRAGHRYEIEASYRNDIYHVALREVPPKGAAREVTLADFASCLPGK
jgi:hypothetical protein